MKKQFHYITGGNKSMVTEELVLKMNGATMTIEQMKEWIEKLEKENIKEIAITGDVKLSR
jgi:pyruvate/2-oxoacid:ferredoxin oxidoreductase alpha subunit